MGMRSRVDPTHHLRSRKEESMRRARYQEGCLTRSKRKSGAVWEYRYRERQPDGSKRMRCIVVGTVAAIKTRATALQHIEVLRANVNREVIETGSPTITTFKSLIEHYREREMRMDNHDKKAYSTKNRNESYLRKWIIPRWGGYRPSDIKSVAVEDCMDTLVRDTGDNEKKPLAGGTKTNIRNSISASFRHGMRHELLPRVEAANPDEVRTAERKEAKHSPGAGGRTISKLVRNSPAK